MVKAADKIIMKGMQFYGYHGALEEEGRLGQRFELDLELYLDLQPAGSTDDLKKTVSYADVYKTVSRLFTEKKYQLLEALAENIAVQIIRHFNLDGVKVRIKKPQAPIDGVFEYMGVEIVRTSKGLRGK
ncbi:dihydroneopterin aldolase [Desulfofalx alkaliphila]|uniref:dihydroneopterin aldolase n=1 Tax=Desulfofalx alkaliphila TaxID=105483 RepID=UPI000AFC06A8